MESVVDAAGLVSAIKHAGPDGIPFIVVPKGSETKSLEPFLLNPAMKRGVLNFETRESFTRYVNEQKVPATRIFMKEQCFTAVLDFHDSTVIGPDAGWMNHKAHFSLKPTPAWTLWRDRNKKVVSQKDFAEFLEENYPDVIEPAGAELLDIASTLQAHTQVRFKRGLRLDNTTEQLQYEETVDAKGGVGGDMEVPRAIKLSLVMFYGEPKTEIVARLKYQIANGVLTFWFEMVRVQDILDAVVQSTAAKIIEETKLVPFNGSL